MNIARSPVEGSTRCLKREFQIPECPKILLSGEPAAAITELARKEEFDLIIMPTHAGVFRWTLLGSVTAKVLNDAECPVLTTEHAQNPGPIERRNWVCGVNPNRESFRVLEIAARAARQVGANLALIHVISNDEQTGESRAIIQEMQVAAGCKEAEVYVCKGPIKESLVSTSRTLGNVLMWRPVGFVGTSDCVPIEASLLPWS